MEWHLVVGVVHPTMDILGALVKKVIDGGNPGISEADLTTLGVEHAQKFRRDNETREQAFARFYEDDADFRKAIQATRHLSVEATRQGDWRQDAPVGKSSPALEEIKKLAGELRMANPKLTKEQAFAKVYEANPELAHRERAENRPVVAFRRRGFRRSRRVGPPVQSRRGASSGAVMRSIK